jgi:hypothetical protein
MMHKSLRDHVLNSFAPVRVFAIGTDSTGAPVTIPMRATHDGGLESEPFGEDASIVGLLADGRFVPLPG